MGRRVYTFFGLLLLTTIAYFNWISPAGGGDGGGAGIRIPIPWLQPDMGFIGRVGTHFVDVDDGSPVYVNGWNSYWLMSSNSESISDIFRRGRAMGMTICRTWAFSDGGSNALQISPGRFDERVFQALDFALYEARRNNIRLILCLVNNLNAFGGKAQYVRWARAAGTNVTSTDAFFSHPIIKHYYKQYAKKILSRKNTFSGVRYKDEPAVFAWELMNEPRCVSNSSAPLLQGWIAEMASFIKSIDRKHMVTVGLEGFYGAGRPERLGANPGDWASSLGSDFIQNSADRNIDFASVHAYPDSWIPQASFDEKVEYVSNWVDYHVNDGERILKKPVLFSEVGSRLRGMRNGSYDRDIILKTVYDKVYESAKKGEAGAGALVWQLMTEGIQGYRDEFSFVARQHPSTYKLILQQSCRLMKLFRGTNKRSKMINTPWPCSHA